jgi:hypothetical protein
MKQDVALWGEEDHCVPLCKTALIGFFASTERAKGIGQDVEHTSCVCFVG